MLRKFYQNKNKGQAMLILVMFFSFVSVSLVLGMASPVVTEFNISKNLLLSKQSYYLAESGIEDGLYRLKANKNISDSETLELGGHSVITNLTTISGSQRKLEAHSNVDNRERKVEIIVNAGVGSSFSYGIQTGNGGFIMDQNSTVDGNVYSNGSISGSNGAKIKGSAFSANSAAATPNQQNGTGAPLQSIVFGNTSSTQDFSQSFQLSSVVDPLSKFQFYIKKTGNPSNCTLRVLNNTGGSPGSTSYATGTLNASSVGSAYAWIDVGLTTVPQLSANTTYWVVIDCSSNSSRYYTIGADSAYVNGQAKIGQFGGAWNNTSPTGLDAFFKVFLGGTKGSINNVDVGTTGVGNAHANTVTNSTIAGNLYCQTGSGNGGKVCNTSLPDPVRIDLPISEGNILDWKDTAQNGGILPGTTITSTTTTIGAKKYDGNLTISGGVNLTLGGTVWVTGNLNIDNNVNIYLSPGYSGGSGMIVVDGEVNISNNTQFHGSGAPGSFIMVLTTSSSINALNLSNNGGAVIVYAQNGTVNISNNGKAKGVTGQSVSVGNNVTITYDTGLANVNFISGPGGAWNITKWKEVES